jgi:hypothetical protein
MDAAEQQSAPFAGARAIPHEQKLDECFGQFPVCVICAAAARAKSTQTLARPVAWGATLKA